MRIPRILRFRRQNLDPVARAEEIKSKFAAKQKIQGLFTPAQQELMDELGLTPGDQHKDKSIPNQVEINKGKRSPLTARQLKLAKELGLIKSDQE